MTCRLVQTMAERLVSRFMHSVVTTGTATQITLISVCHNVLPADKMSLHNCWASRTSHVNFFINLIFTPFKSASLLKQLSEKQHFWWSKWLFWNFLYVPLRWEFWRCSLLLEQNVFLHTAEFANAKRMYDLCIYLHKIYVFIYTRFVYLFTQDLCIYLHQDLQSFWPWQRHRRNCTSDRINGEIPKFQTAKN